MLSAITTQRAKWLSERYSVGTAIGSRNPSSGGWPAISPQTDFAGGFVGACHDEWLNRAGADPEVLEQFLEHRVDTLETLARKDHWLDLASIPGGQYVFDTR